MNFSDLGVPETRWFPTVGSTMDEARAWLEAGAPDQALVGADQQTAGRGRLGRAWVTQPGASLAFSLILRPIPSELPNLERCSALAALGICQALEDLGLPGGQAAIKWPNDVLLDGHKVAGILIENHWQAQRLAGLVIGIGVNVTPAALPPPERLRFPATSVETALGRPVDRTALLRAILRGLLAWRPLIGSERFLQAWEERLAYRGQWVRVGLADPGELALEAALEGRLMGIDPAGRLILEDARGTTTTLEAGEISLRPAPENDPR